MSKLGRAKLYIDLAVEESDLNKASLHLDLAISEIIAAKEYYQRVGIY